ncbi:MAG TPA: hypothetical protein VGU61_19730 [Noviherbaspirillum sp.]|uniref:hypothetical protein n=1 Tax=Noviherbaspirillum sp. TaxID=1926288 RepID=UPI002DDCE778|nr:hypothetical protein [Noviherbaspirillum sp.]HEV2612502.1 hypothetical protein [Noviherbaspirillum sp.]
MEAKHIVALEEITRLCEDHMQRVPTAPNPTVVAIKRVVALALADVPKTKDGK